jgi:hypothetical protein
MGCALRLMGCALLLMGCAPRHKAVATPIPPAGEQVSHESVLLACAGRPERLDCAVRATTRTSRERLTVDSTITTTPPRHFEQWAPPAPVARHPVVASDRDEAPCRFESGCRHDLQVRFGPTSRRGPGYSRHLRLQLPPGMHEVARREHAERVDVVLRSSPETTSLGGPVLALGRRLGEVGTVARIGWEAFAPLWLSHAVGLDATSEGDATLAYVAQAVTGRWLFLPSLGVGLGVPLSLTAPLVAGLRAQATLAFPYVGLVGWVDVFAEPEPEPRGWLALTLSL